MGNMRSAMFLFASLFLCCLLPAVGLAQSASYSSVLSTMQVRQEQLEKTQLDPKSCLGERLDGFLEINYDCPTDIAKLAEEENGDRKTLFGLMAVSLGSDAQAVGTEWAKKRSPRYVEGVLRQNQCANGSTTFWNGRLPNPCENDVARVLTIQYAKIYSQPSTSGKIVRDNLPLYEAFGVVKKEKDAGGILWYQVTEEYVPKQKPANWNPKTLGWVAEQDAIPWKRALVMRFNNGISRKPAIFFKKPENVIDIAQKELSQRRQVLDGLYADLDASRIDGTSGMVAVEPTVGRDQQQMVMYPVLDFHGSVSDQMMIDGMSTRILEVAAQTRGGDGPNSTIKGSLPIDIVFVMDLTSSMQPYVDKLISAMNNFVKEVGNQDIRFGFIGYQDKDKKYYAFTVKQFTPNVLTPNDFLKVLSTVEANKIIEKGDDIPEAVMNGVNLALESTQWREKSAKFIFLIGDSPDREDDFSIKELQDKSFTRKIPLLAFYIDHSRGADKWSVLGKKQNRELSVTWEGAYGTSRQIEHVNVIDGGSLADFESRVYSNFLEAKVDFDKLITAGIDKKSVKPDNSLSYLIFQQAELLLADPSNPKKAVTGWVADKVLDNPSREALAPMILLNEAELDELEQRVTELKDIGEMALRGDKGTTLDFFDLVGKNTRFTIVNPTAVNFRDAFSVPLGIDALPYNSDIMATTREEFENMDRVQGFVRSMKNKLRHYEDLKRQQGNPDVWKKLSSGTSERDRVVGVELNQLP